MLLHSMVQVCSHACVKPVSSITNVYKPHMILSNKKGQTIDSLAYICWLPSTDSNRGPSG